MADTALTPQSRSMHVVQIDRLNIEDKIISDAHDKLVDLRQMHAYVKFCYEKGRISEEQFKSLCYDLEEGWTAVARMHLVDYLAANEFRVKMVPIDAVEAGIEQGSPVIEMPPVAQSA